MRVFDCQKTFKRRLWVDIKKGTKIDTVAKCPQCGSIMANMGKDFEAPKKGDHKAWQHIKDLFVVGITWHSCGCTGPGYIPKDKTTLLLYLEEIIQNYQKELLFWRSRVEPKTKQDKIKDEQRNWHKYGVIRPNRKKEFITNAEGIAHWINKIKAVELMILKVKEGK